VPGFVLKFDPAMTKPIRRCRTAMDRLFPSANEWLGDNYTLGGAAHQTNQK